MKNLIQNTILFALALTSNVAFGQKINVQPICDTYANRALFLIGEIEFGKSCEEIRDMAMKLTLKETTFAGAREGFKRFADLKINIREAKKSYFPEWMKCEIKKTAELPSVLCKITVFGTPATMTYQGGSYGYVESLNITIEDASPLVKLGLEGQEIKTGIKWLPLATEFMLDVLTAKNNAIAPFEERYHHAQKKLSVQILNLNAYQK